MHNESGGCTKRWEFFARVCVGCGWSVEMECMDGGKEGLKIRDRLKVDRDLV